MRLQKWKQYLLLHDKLSERVNTVIEKGWYFQQYLSLIYKRMDYMLYALSNMASSPSNKTPLKVGGVERHAHKQSGDETRAGQGDDPRREDESDLLPVHSADVEVAERNTDGGTSKALGGRHRQAKTAGKQDSDGGTELHGEATGRRHLGDLVTERPHDVEAVDPESDTEQETGDDEDPDGSISLGRDLASLVSVVRSHPGADSVGHIVGAVRNGHHHG